MKEKKESVAGDVNAMAQFINSTGEISETLYLATHPEEKDEAPPATVVRP